MEQNLWIQESFVNATEGYTFGDNPGYETYTDNVGRLFRDMQREYGRCTSKVYRDTENGVQQIGWVFQKRLRYEDARRDWNGRYSEKDYYIREVWVTVHDAPDTVTREPHFHAFGKV